MEDLWTRARLRRLRLQPTPQRCRSSGAAAPRGVRTGRGRQDTDHEGRLRPGSWRGQTPVPRRIASG